MKRSTRQEQPQFDLSAAQAFSPQPLEPPYARRGPHDGQRINGKPDFKKS